MEGLDIRIVKDREDFRGISGCDILKKFNWPLPENKYYAAAALDGNFVGFWDGDVGHHFVSKSIGAKDSCFYSNMIFTRVGNKGIGTEIKRHQLEFAREIGCKSSYCEVLNPSNIYAIKIQRRLEREFKVRERDMGSEGYQFCFDLWKLDL